jgi:hypothetical protein
MKRLLIVLIALVAIFALVLPAGAVELKFGGLFAQKVYSTNNQHNGDDDVDDNTNWLYTRMRLYFTGVASENLKAVSKFEIDDFWGDSRLGSVSADGGSNNDNAGMEIKNAYIDFIVPDTALNIKVGIIGARLDKPAWVFNDDTSGLFAAYKYGEWYFAGLYSRLGDNNSISPPTTWQGNGPNEPTFDPEDNSKITPTDASDDVDIWAFALNYNMEGIFTAANFAWITNSDQFGGTAHPGNDYDLYVISFDGDYSSDVFSVYGDVAFNAGKNKQTASSQDFKGYAFMAGGTFTATDMITVGGDFYYASGNKSGNNDVKAFQTAGAPTGRNAYNMDEVIFPGWFDDDTSTINGGLNISGVTNNNITATGLGTNAGYCLTNIWALGVHGDIKPLEKTLIQVGGAYMAFVEKVPDDASKPNSEDDSLGYSFYARLSQGVVDGLTLKASAGYFIADDGFTDNNNDDNAYRLAMGLFYSW